MSVEGPPDSFPYWTQPENPNSDSPQPENPANTFEVSDQNSDLRRTGEASREVTASREGNASRQADFDATAAENDWATKEALQSSSFKGNTISQEEMPQADDTGPSRQELDGRRGLPEPREIAWVPQMYPATMESLALFRAEFQEVELPYQKSLAYMTDLMNVMQDQCKEVLVAFQYAQEQGDEVNHAAILWQLTDAAALMRTAYQILYRAPTALAEEGAPQMSAQEHHKRMMGANSTRVEAPDAELR